METGVCSWCIDRHDVVRAIEVAGRELDLRVVQIGFFSAKAVETADVEAIVQTSRAVNVWLAGSFVGFEGEDYLSIERIAATGGYLPDDVYAARLAMTRDAAALSAAVGCRSVAVHACTIPHDAMSPIYTKLVERVREAADVVADYGVRLLLETGRESADTLLGFLNAVSHNNVGVNFDPGNLVLYGTDEPGRAVSKLKDRIGNVHLKDAVRSTRPGIDYGQVVPLGTGHAQIPRVVSKLRATGYTGPLLVETPASGGDLGGIRDAIGYLHSMLG